MAAREKADPAKTRLAVLAVSEWLRDETRPAPDRDVLRRRRCGSPRAPWPQRHPAPASKSGSHRLPRCSVFPDRRHTRGTPPNVVETDPRTWLLLATGMLSLAEAKSTGALTLSGSRAREIDHWLPLIAVS